MADETRVLFRFERVGKVPLAKKYGMLECYSVEWSENKTGAIRFKIISQLFFVRFSISLVL